MPTYNSIERHPLLHTRAQALALCKQLGFQFASSAPIQSPSRRPQRPRLAGATRDASARIELIGPDEAIFKAALLVSRAAPDADQALARLRDFVDAWLPTWTDRSAWLAASYAVAGPQPPVEVRFDDLVISLRSADYGAATALTLSYAFFGEEQARGSAKAGRHAGS
jgi:hypothetical protein